MIIKMDTNNISAITFIQIPSINAPFVFSIAKTTLGGFIIIMGIIFNIEGNLLLRLMISEVFIEALPYKWITF